jgi:ABC-type transport system substrate-binding protein
VIPWVTEPIAHELESETGVTLSISPTSRWVMRLIPNLSLRGTLDPVAAPHPMLSDVNVRLAIRSAIDVDTISDELFYGYGEPTWSEFFRPPYNTCDIARPVRYCRRGLCDGDRDHHLFGIWRGTGIDPATDR